MSERLRVLIVDDQAIILEAVRGMLADAGDLELDLLSDAGAAIETALRVKPHVVLLDLNMEPIDGLEVLTRIRSHPELADVSVVMLSTAEEAQTKVEAFRRGANDYVVKLPSALELIARVRYHARASAAASEREAAFRELLESRAALELRNRQVEQQKVQLELMNQELTEASLTDALTGLRNRRYLKFFLDQSEPRASVDDRRRRAPGRFTFCLFDLDHFKQTNDRYGHEVGDSVLVEVARRLRATMRDSDGLLRWGGEEFLVVGRGFDRNGEVAFAQRVLHCIGGEDMHLPGGHRLRITCSLGFATLPWSHDRRASPLNSEQALNLADFALYLSKFEGRNRGCGVFPGPDASLLQRLSTLAMDPDALRREDGRGVLLHRLLGASSD